MHKRLGDGFYEQRLVREQVLKLIVTGSTLRSGQGAVALQAKSGGYGISVSASVNAAKGSEKGKGLTHSETTLDAGNRLSLTSGRDITLTGAQASGESVKVDAGRNLTLTSEQDSDRYDSKQQSASAGGSFTFGSMTGSANVNVSRDKMHSTWQSVAEQTGIFAGKGGFDVTVGEHTQLNGAVISSTASADKNRLDTGTLGFGDIENHADYKVEHQSAGMSTGGNIGGDFAGNMANGMLAGLNDSGSVDSTTKAAVSEGTIVIRDKEQQTQNVADLSRDVANANPGLDVIFDKEKEQNRLKAAQLIGEIGAQAGDIARTQGQIAGMKAQQDPAALQAAREQLAVSGKPYTEADISQRAYDNAMKPFGTGSSLQQGISAVTAAVQGLSGGNLAQAISGASAPYLAEKIHELTTDANGKVNVQANLMAHAVLGAVTSYAAGNAALAGASGAVMGEYIAQQLYPGVKREDLSEEQRQTISALGTLAAGLAGGVVGDSTADAVAGAQAGKNAVENNNLALVARGCAALSPCRNKVAEQLLEIGAKAGITGLAGVAIKDVADKITSDELEHLVTLQMMGNDEITRKYLSSLHDKYAPVHTGGDQIAGSGPANTGGNQQLDPNDTPTNTGNNQASGQGATNTGNTEGKPDTVGNILVNPGADPLTKKDIVYLSENSNSKIDTVINETLSGKKNFTSSTTLSSDEALAAGLKFLGTGYKEIGKPGSGVYHSADGTKEFRIDSGSIGGAHAPGVPHVHFGVKNPTTGKYISNNHVPYKD
ncbi:filamentous hemagglutinin [Pantoea agglomerans]|nr:VENN motif pre-toxin domain-containing protein [Pantoea agglomerans]MBA8871516.1 filamentous hemagglutinin [Pantoea agglomerans]MBA8875894.1 filamentous hemagglutinin [Pantoea agglomerans]